MSAAAPTATAGPVVPAKKGMKKLIVIGIAALLLVMLVGGGLAVSLKKKAAAGAGAGDDAAAAAEQHSKPDLKHPPTFLALDPFVVNLVDKDADRYAQIGITIEVEDAKFAEQMKAFMPALRNGILMILAGKSSRDLLDRAGKEQLAAEILRESSRTMGIEVADPEPAPAKAASAAAASDDGADAADDEPKPKRRAKPRAPAEPNPIRHVHFSNFIVQ